MGPELHFPNSTLAASKSVAKSSHLCAKPSNLPRSAWVRAVCAASRHRLAFSRHSFGLPGMTTTLMIRNGHSHVHRRAARALEGQSSQLTHDRMPLSADQPRGSTALFAGGAIDQITGYDFNCKHCSINATARRKFQDIFVWLSIIQIVTWQTIVLLLE
jgi:hypothetical protein